MRSEYVFAAAREISNRFLLCRVASVSARRLQVGAKQPSETINQSLRLIAATELTQWRREDMPEANNQVAPVVLPELTESTVTESTVIDGELLASVEQGD